MGPSGRRHLSGPRRGGGAIPAATQRLAQRHERLQARQAVLCELVTGGIQSALRLQQRQKVPGSPLIAQLRPLKGAFALCHAALLEFTHRVQVLDGGERLLDIDQGGDDRRAIGREQLVLLGECFVALCRQTAVIENRLGKAGDRRLRGADARDRVDDGGKRRILHTGRGGERQTREHRRARRREVRVCGA